MKLEFSFKLELTENEMSAGNPNLIGGLDFSMLISAVNNVTGVLSTVATRLQNVAPQAGSTDEASSKAAQQEIEVLAGQLNSAVQSLNQVNQAAQSLVTATPAPPPDAAASVPGTPESTTGASPATPADTGTPQVSGTAPGETAPASPAPASPEPAPAPTETGQNIPS